MFYTTGQFLKRGLAKKYIKISDLYTTDDQVLLKLKKHLKKDKILNRWFLRMNNKMKFKNDKKDYQYKAVVKSRAVDPFFKDGKKLKRLSQVYLKWNKIVQEESRPKVYYLKFQV